MVLIVLLILAGITALEFVDVQNLEMDFSYLEPLILVTSFYILVNIVGSIMDRMIYLNH